MTSSETADGCQRQVSRSSLIDMGVTSRGYNDEAMLAGLEALPDEAVIDYEVASVISYSPPIANGITTAKVVVTQTWTVDVPTAQQLIEESS